MIAFWCILCDHNAFIHNLLSNNGKMVNEAKTLMHGIPLIHIESERIRKRFKMKMCVHNWFASTWKTINVFGASPYTKDILSASMESRIFFFFFLFIICITIYWCVYSSVDYDATINQAVHILANGINANSNTKR